VRRGLLYALAACLSWGLLPIYWKQLGAVPPLDLALYRLLFSGPFLLGVLLLRGRGDELLAVGRTPSALRPLLLSGALIVANWAVFLAAVASGRLVEAGLGYFLTPLANVALGAWWFGERLSRPRQAAVGLALAGSLTLGWALGGVPWVALGLVLTFSGYSLLRKVASTDALLGSTVEMGLWFLPALAAWGLTGGGRGVELPWTGWALLGCSGAATALPLLWFAEAARRLPLSVLGFVQYLSPLGHLLVGVALYQEPFDQARALAFSFIAAAVLVSSVELWATRRAAG
jgi:chloramphenicol-sensitive protein RarD